MSFFKLIINNVLRSARTYGSYFLASTFSVFVFFTFAMLTFHPQMRGGIQGSSGDVSELAGFGMIASQVLIVLLSIIFLWYSFWTFVKARKRDLGIYLMLGMKPKDLRKILFGENMLIGFVSIFTGVGLGVLFTKVILIVIQNLLGIITGLRFYFPTLGILLTVVVFLGLYLLISLIMTLRIETETLSQLGKSDETPQPLPKTHPLLVVLAFMCLAGGYGSLVYFIYGSSGMGLLLVLACVLLTVLGTFLFFHQVVVYFYKGAKKRSSYWQGKKLLGIAEGIYKAKSNATMFALIACTASVALVGISVTVALGSSETGSRNSISTAFVLNESVTKADQVSNTSKTAQEMINIIKAGGHTPLYSQVITYPMGYQEKGAQDQEVGTYIAYCMKASDYNQVAKRFGFEALHPKANEIIAPASTAVEENKYQEEELSQRQQTLEVDLQSGTKEFTLTSQPVRFRIANMYRFFIAPDDVVTQFQIAEDDDYPMIRYQLLDFKEWRTDENVNQKLLTLLHDKQDKYEELSMAPVDENLSDKEMEEHWEKLYNDYYLQYESRYEGWQKQRQSNGLILMIGVLLGGVFFIFTASIMYFRLFGDLDKEGRYHRSLYQLGLQPKQRHQIVTKQLVGMFYIPMLVATIHSAVAYWGIVQLSSLNLWHYFFIIIACYGGLMTLLFIICRWRYLVHLDVRAENPQGF